MADGSPSKACPGRARPLRCICRRCGHGVSPDCRRFGSLIFIKTAYWEVIHAEIARRFPLGREMRQLPIIWQRLVSADGKTCVRCDATHQHLTTAVAKLRDVLKPLDI